jgi:gamma-glutamylcyclotransferase (GGCT)/AIG2-like uncharacterized protein YtfP
MSVYVFVYGTLQVEAVLLKVLGRVPELRPARVAGFCCYRFTDASYPGAVSDPAGCISGMLLGPLSADELGSLHVYEGERYASVACAAALEVPSDDGELASVPGGAAQVAASIYLVVPAFRPLLAASHWDLNQWLTQDSAAFLENL